MRMCEKLPVRMRIHPEVTHAHGRRVVMIPQSVKLALNFLDIWIQKRALAIMIENKTQFLLLLQLP